MSEFVVGIVVNVLRHIGVQHRKRGGIGWISSSTGHFAVRNAPELVVLHPEVSLENFGCCRESKHGCITPDEAAVDVLHACLPPEPKCCWPGARHLLWQVHSSETNAGSLRLSCCSTFRA